MILQFKTSTVTFSEEDRDYFEKRFLPLKKFLGNEAGKDEDTIHVDIKVKKNKHHTGERFEGEVTVFAPHHGKFHAETDAENIKKCADDLADKLKTQFKKFHEKK